MSKQGTQKVGKMFSYIAIVLVLVAVCGLLAYFTNGFTTDFKTFYVECDGKQVLSSGNGYHLTYGEPTTVDVKYTFGALSQETSGYFVKVVPKTDNDNDFDFTLDGKAYSFYGETDFTKGFNIVQEANSFTIEPKGNIDDIIKAVYPTYEVAIPDDETIDFSKDMFTLIVYSYNNEASVSINFMIDDYRLPKGITIDKEVIVF